MLKYDLAEDYIIETMGEKYFANLEVTGDKRNKGRFYFNHAKQLIKEKRTRSFMVNKIVNQMILSSGGLGRNMSTGGKYFRRGENDIDNNGYLSNGNKVREEQ